MKERGLCVLSLALKVRFPVGEPFALDKDKALGQIKMDLLKKMVLIQGIGGFRTALLSCRTGVRMTRWSWS